jgi:hypothetical protein
VPFLKKYEEKNNLRDVDVGGRIILKWLLLKGLFVRVGCSEFLD